MARHALRQSRIVRTWNDRVGTAGFVRLTRLLPKPPEPSGSGTNVTRHVERISRAPPSTREDFSRLDAPDDRHVHDERPRGPGDVAAGEADACFSRQLEQAIEQTVHLANCCLKGELEREQRGVRRPWPPRR